MSSRKSVVLLVLLLGVVCLTTAGCATRIGPGHVGIKIDLAGSNRGAESMPLRTGWVFYNPFSSQVVEYPTFMQTAIWSKDPNEANPSNPDGPPNEEITFTTKDAMVVAADVNMSYTLDAERVPQFYVRFRSDDLSSFSNGFLHNVARDCFNETAGKYGVEDIMGNNAPFLHDARTCLQSQVDSIGVQIAQFGIIGAPRPPQSVIESINAKVQAAQLALQKQNEVVQAQADAAKNVAWAKGDADASIARANGEAEANRIRSASINPNIIEWQKLAVQQQWIARWNGQTPSVNASGNAGLLFNMDSK